MAEPFAYAVLRLVPDAERDEALNVGVVLHCRTLGGFLALRTALDAERMAAAFGPRAPDAALVAAQLAHLERVAQGDPAAGPIARLEPWERFGWLTGASSTVVRAGPVHTGLTDDPPQTLDRLFARLVA